MTELARQNTTTAGACPLCGAEALTGLCLPGARLAGSSYERGFGPAQVGSGRLWPLPLDPTLWISRDLPREDPWLQATFTRGRPVERIELLWAPLAGWSSDFAPPEVRLIVKGDEARMEPLLDSIIPVTDDGLTLWQAPRGPLEGVRSVRIELAQPTRTGVDRRARMAALRVIGPHGPALP